MSNNFHLSFFQFVEVARVGGKPICIGMRPLELGTPAMIVCAAGELAINSIARLFVPVFNKYHKPDNTPDEEPIEIDAEAPVDEFFKWLEKENIPVCYVKRNFDEGPSAAVIGIIGLKPVLDLIEALDPEKEARAFFELYPEYLALHESNTGPLYYHSFNEEDYSSAGHATPEEAAQDAFAEDPTREVCYVGKGVKPNPEHFVHGEDVIERIQCQDEFTGDWAGDWPGATKDQMVDLDVILRKAMAEWLDKHDLRPEFYNVTGAAAFHNPAFKDKEPDFNG